MKDNYEILKEHELTIIKLGTVKTKETKRNLTEKIDKLKQDIKSKEELNYQ